LHGVIESNDKQWLFKGFNSGQWQTTLAMMHEKGPMLFATVVGSLNGKG
jgi:hypothetical protein